MCNASEVYHEVFAAARSAVKTDTSADFAQPGYGNFCFGRRKVDSILDYSPQDSGAAQYSVTYHYSVPAPEWANNAEIKTAFPQVGRDVAGANASAMLTKTDNGWAVGRVSEQ